MGETAEKTKWMPNKEFLSKLPEKVDNEEKDEKTTRNEQRTVDDKTPRQRPSSKVRARSRNNSASSGKASGGRRSPRPNNFTPLPRQESQTSVNSKRAYHKNGKDNRKFDGGRNQNFQPDRQNRKRT